MVQPYTQDEMFREWESLLKTVQQHQDELGGVIPFHDALATAHHTAVTSRNVRDSLNAAAKEETRRLNESLVAGRDAAACLRHYIQCVLGVRSEKLRLYGIKARKRARSAWRAPGCVLPS